MIVLQLNDLVMNTPESGYLLTQEIDGLGMPDVRLSSGVYTGKSGGYASTPLYGNRGIGLQGTIVADTVAQLDQRRTALTTALSSGDVTLKLTTNAGNAYVIYCKVAQPLDMPILDTQWSSTFQIELLAPDYIIYMATSDDSDLTAPLSLLQSGGLTWPLTWPLTWSAGTGATVINNVGTVETYPTITLNDSASAPVLTNTTTGKILKLPSLTTSDGDELVIDIKNRVALLNGGNITADVSTDSDWWPLLPGENRITLTYATTPANDMTGTVAWMPGVIGI